MKVAWLVGLVALVCIPALAVAPSATLPPGAITGRLIEADGVTPHALVKVALRDAATMSEVASTVADEAGKFAFENVPVGKYVVYVGNPGLGAYLNVVEGATPGTLDITVPKAMALPAPAALPDWWNQQTNTTKALIGGGGALLLGGAIWFYNEHDDRATGGKILSPIRR